MPSALFRAAILQDEVAVEIAIDRAGQARTRLPDRMSALRNNEAGCSRTMTFDKASAKAVPAMELIP